MKDLIFPKANINFSKKMQKMRLGDHLSKGAIKSSMPDPLTKRPILSQLQTVYDPLGLICAVTMQGKILFRKMWQEGGKNLGWDSAVSEEWVQRWAEYFEDLLEVNGILFPRSIKPVGSIGNPGMVTFSDGSDDAMGAVVFARWYMGQDKKYESRLVMAKGKLCPFNAKGDTVKSELNGALMAKRLREFVEINLKIEFEYYVHLVDSEIVRAMIQRESYGFKTFAANRVGEIQSKTQKDEWEWIPGSENISDIVTRGANASDLGPKSNWQNGMPWMSLPREEWPSSKLFNDEKEEEISKFHRQSIKVSTSNCVATEKSDGVWMPLNLSKLIDVTKYSDIKKLQRVTIYVKRLLDMIRSRSKKAEVNCKAGVLTVQEVEEAEKYWVIVCQSEISISQVTKKRLVAYWEDGVIVTKGRWGSEAMLAGFDKPYIPVLPYRHAVSHLIVLDVHNRLHGGVDATLAVTRKSFWIIKARNWAKLVVNRCVSCRAYRKKAAGQIMGDLPSLRMGPAPAFYYTSVDLFGPVAIKGEVQKRIRGKCYGVVYTCLASRSVFCDVASDYSTEGFLLSLRRFVTIRGAPRFLYSDPGSQLAAASNELVKFREGWDIEKLKEFGNEKKMQWEFCAPEAQHRNGVSESMVKAIKKCMVTNIVNKSVMTFSETQTVVYECANLVNERPLFLKQANNDSEVVYLNANQMLLGRSSPRAPAGPFEKTGSKPPLKRFELVQEIVDGFWKSWMTYYFPTLMIRQRWHTSVRNLMIGDVVLVQDSNALRGSWKFALVTDVFPDKKGKVRTAEVSYKNISVDEPVAVYKGKSSTIVKRPATKIVVIVPKDEDVVLKPGQEMNTVSPT